MYIPKAFKVTNLNIVHSFIEKYSFGAIITHAEGFKTTHIPFVLNRTLG
jgi:predicted FMN-binding regulatory protein PaiB